MKKLRILILIAAAACLCSAHQVQKFPGTNLPIVMSPQDLTGDYFAMKIKEQSSGALGDYYSSYAFQFVGLNSFSSSSASRTALNDVFELIPVSWTKNETISLYGEQFLVTYIWEPAIEEIRTFAEGAPFKKIELKLKLIKSNQIGTIEPFPGLTREGYLKKLDEFQHRDGDRKIAPPGAQTSSLSNIKQYALGLVMYSADYDDVLPYVQSSRSLQDVVRPYIKNDEVFKTLNPNKPGMFLFNMSLAGVTATQIEEVANTPMLFDPTPWPDGRYIVAYADSHAKIESAEKWASLQKYFKLKLKRTGKPIKP